ncbi:MAG: RNA polymerase sigma factor [Acidimicrobiales bacterium]
MAALEAPEDEDEGLLHLVAQGDQEALSALYDRHAAWLTVRLSRRCSSADVVDQAVQDTFVALWRRAGSYRGRGEVAAFIWGIGIRRLIDAIRRDRPATRWLPGRADRGELVVSAEDQVLLGIEHGGLGQALAELSPELRGAIEATVLDGLTCADAGVLLGVSEGTVKSRCHRARQALRAALVQVPGRGAPLPPVWRTP